MKNYYCFNEDNSLSVYKIYDGQEVSSYVFDSLENAKQSRIKSLENRLNILTREFNDKHVELSLQIDLIKNF